MEKLKNEKIHFFVTKSGQNLNLMIFSDPRPKYCMYFISTFPSRYVLHTSITGGVWSRNFGKGDIPPERNKDFSAQITWYALCIFCPNVQYKCMRCYMMMVPIPFYVSKFFSCQNEGFFQDCSPYAANQVLDVMIFDNLINYNNESSLKDSFHLMKKLKTKS